MEGRGVQAGRGVTGEAARRATEKFGLKQSSETLEKNIFCILYRKMNMLI